jgi:hypothetical protein
MSKGKSKVTMSQPALRQVFIRFPTEHGERKESLWAYQAGITSTAQIANIPFATEDIGQDDLVQVAGSGEVLAVLRRATSTRHARFEPACDPREARRQWEAIVEHLGRQNIDCEAAWPGVFGMAVPLTLDDPAFRDHLGQCPVPLALIGPEAAVELWVGHVDGLRASRFPEEAAPRQDDAIPATWTENGVGSFTGSDGSQVRAFSQGSLIHDPGPQGFNAGEWRRAESLDFSTSEVPRPTCRICGRRFRDFRRPAAVWERLPDHYLGMPLCEDDFRALVREAGLDPDAVRFGHSVWPWKRAEWAESRRFPPRYAHLCLDSREVLWCEAVQHEGDGKFLVRLVDSTLFSRPLRRGACLLARWNGTRRHGITGRALLKPVSECGGETVPGNMTLVPGNGLLERARSWESVEDIRGEATGGDEARGHSVKLKSTRPRLKDPEAVAEVLAGYTFESGAVILQAEEGGAATLELVGDGWPLAWRNEPRPVDEVLPVMVGRRTELAADGVARERARGFIELLCGLAPYLENSLTVWASLFSSDGKFQGAREWSIAPGATRVEVMDIKAADSQSRDRRGGS